MRASASTVALFSLVPVDLESCVITGFLQLVTQSDYAVAIKMPFQSDDGALVAKYARRSA